MEPYYKRLDPTHDLENAYSTDKITTELKLQSEKFYNDGVMVVSGDWEPLKRVFPRSKVVRKDEDGSCVLKIDEWPHCKYMCLLFCPDRPTKWRYVTKDNDESVLFDYDLRTRKVTFSEEVLEREKTMRGATTDSGDEDMDDDQDDTPASGEFSEK